MDSVDEDMLPGTEAGAQGCFVEYLCFLSLLYLFVCLDSILLMKIQGFFLAPTGAPIVMMVYHTYIQRTYTYIQRTTF